MDIKYIIKIQAIIRGYLIRKNILNNPLVLSWILCREYFLNIHQHKEKLWGNTIINKYLYHKFTNQWTSVLGEYIVYNLLKNKGYNVYKPKKKNGYKPDLESDDYVYEIKTRCYSVKGTAGEKILGTPYKYADVPKLYNKPLIIILVGYQEYEGKHIFKLFDDDISDERKMILTLYKTIGITYKCASDLL